VTRLVPLKRLVDPRRPITYGIVQAGPNVEGGVPYIRPVDMNGHRGVPDPSTLRTTSPDIAESYRRSSVTPGDIIVSIGPSYGKTMIVPAALAGANLTQGTARVAPASWVDARFLLWALQSKEAIHFWDVAVGGATFRALNLEPLAETPVPDVSLTRQRAIADYLDAETARIDALIEKKRLMVELQEELFVARIYDVTASLTPVPLRRVASVTYGLGQPPSLSADGIPIIRATNIKRGRIDSEGLIRAARDDLPLNRAPLLRSGEILVVRSGAYTGDSAVVTEEWAGAAPGYDLRVTPHSMNPRLLALQMLGRRFLAFI
jgi:type I restriction enzyme, S subunit